MTATFKKLKTMFGKKSDVEEPTAFEQEYTLSSTQLGKGAYAEVRLAHSRKTSKTVAVKIIKKETMSEKEVKKIRQEVTILKALHHKNIVRVYDSFEQEKEFLIVMEYIKGGELFTKIVDEEVQFTEEKTRKIVKTLAEALRHCKDRGVVHRDLKPENILLTSDGDDFDIKIVDFNLGKKLDPEVVTFDILETMCGTPNYVAPEVLSKKPYGFKCDIWSLGVISFLLLSGGYLPFFVNPRTEGREELLAKVREGRWKFTPERAWTNVSPMAKDFLSKILRRDPEARLGYEQLLVHPWFKAEGDGMKSRIDMSRLLQFNDKRRLLAASYTKGAADIMGELMEENNYLWNSVKPNKVLPQDSGSGGFDMSFGG